MGAFTTLGHCANGLCGSRSTERSRERRRSAALAAAQPAGCAPAPRAPEVEHQQAEVVPQATSSTWSWVLPIFLYLTLELLQRIGLPILNSARLWALMSVLCFSAWSAVEPKSRPQKWRPPKDAAEDPPAHSSLEEFLESLAQQLNERSPPTEIHSLKADGWKDISTRGAQIFMKMKKVPRMVTQIYINVNSSDQEKYFPWVLMDGNTIKGGAIPIFLALDHWPSWFPFCQKVEKLAQLGTNQAIFLVRFKIAFLTVDIVLMAALVDNLQRDGKVELLFTTPPPKCSSWMGITVPKRTASFRLVLRGMRLSVRPRSDHSGQIVLQAETIDEVQFEWATMLFWRACASRIIGLIARMQDRFEGSILQSHYSVDGQEADAQRAHFKEVKANIDSYCIPRR